MHSYHKKETFYIEGLFVKKTSANIKDQIIYILTPSGIITFYSFGSAKNISKRSHLFLLGNELSLEYSLGKNIKLLQNIHYKKNFLYREDNLLSYALFTFLLEFTSNLFIENKIFLDFNIFINLLEDISKNIYKYCEILAFCFLELIKEGYLAPDIKQLEKEYPFLNLDNASKKFIKDVFSHNFLSFFTNKKISYYTFINLLDILKKLFYIFFKKNFYSSIFLKNLIQNKKFPLNDYGFVKEEKYNAYK